MVKGVKGKQSVKGDYVVVRVMIPRNTHRALKVKCALMDMTIKEVIVDILDKGVKGVKRDIEALKAKV